MEKPSVAIVRGKFLNAYEMQFYEPLTRSFSLTAFGSLTSYHKQFAFPTVLLPSPMDIPDVPYKMPVINRLFVDAHYLLGLEKKLDGFDLVHTAETYFHYTQQCLNAKRSGRVKIVIATVLENIAHNNEGILGRRAFKARARNELDWLIALTQKTKKALIEEGADESKISIINHYIDTKRFFPTQALKRRLADRELKKLTILFCGRIEEYKGVFDILAVAKRLLFDTALSKYQLKFIFVGSGSKVSEVDGFIRTHALEKYIEIVSAPYDQMPSMYQRADIFIAPSKPTPTYDEQYCTVLLEAQASGLPIVTTNTGGIPENVGGAGVLVPPGDVRALADGVKQFILRPDLRVRFSTKARSRAEHVHDIRVGAQKLTDLYSRLLSMK